MNTKSYRPVLLWSNTEPRIILCMHPANESWHYRVRPSLIGWAHTQNDLCWTHYTPFSQDQGYHRWHMYIISHIMCIWLCWASLCCGYKDSAEMISYLIACHMFYCGVSRDQSGYGLSQWETMLHCNIVSHWPSPNLEWSLVRQWLHVSNVALTELTINQIYFNGFIYYICPYQLGLHHGHFV